ncbi:hypothetical protein F7725_022141 [Dissostichus mawsoni]|uniref:Nuclear pore complex NUP2/50/61 domain-containing protein n=1 Tax=Dissostichus mawsoni TaxID=36200 RepID=A0A7J5ZD35_DISMA|nr:hypothetical protein F7725_022141 [Dissostichus mawsoni]
MSVSLTPPPPPPPAPFGHNTRYHSSKPLVGGKTAELETRTQSIKDSLSSPAAFPSLPVCAAPVPVWQEVLMVLMVLDLDLETGHLLHHFPPDTPTDPPLCRQHHSLSMEGFPTSKLQEKRACMAGTFLVATEDVLKSRAIKKAKRRNIGEAESGGSSFKGFKGFSLTPALGGGPAPTGFSGFGNGGGGFTGLTFSSDTKQTNGSSSLFSSSSSSSHKEYSRQLTALNCSVRDWITKHVNDNPLCDLNPIFRDYEKHLGSIERQYGEKKKDPLPPSTVPLPLAASSSSSSPFSFTKTPAEETNQSATFNFGQKVEQCRCSLTGGKSLHRERVMLPAERGICGVSGGKVVQQMARLQIQIQDHQDHQDLLPNRNRCCTNRK